MSASVLRVAGVRFGYPGRAPLDLPDVDLAEGEAAALIGPSGSGKTTLLMLIAGLLAAQGGAIEVDGVSPFSLRGAARDRWRGRTIGIVLQSFELLPHLTVLENLTVAQYLAGNGSQPAAARAALEELGIAELAGERPARLSRGQAQRAAIARAIVNRPRLILADEPTSSLDDAATEAAMTLLLSAVTRLNAALLVATHDQRVRAQIPRRISLLREAA